MIFLVPISAGVAFLLPTIFLNYDGSSVACADELDPTTTSGDSSAQTPPIMIATAVMNLS
jgi:hypothetical protein